MFHPKKATCKYIVRAVAQGNIWDVTGEITVVPGKLHYVRIEDMEGGKGKEVYDVEMTADETIRLVSAGYDQYDN